MSKGVERSFWSLPLATLNLYRGYDSGIVEYLSDAVVDSPHPFCPKCRPRSDLRKNIPRSVLDGRLHKKIGKNLMNRDRHRATTTVLLRLLRNLLNDGADNIHLRPGKFTAVPKSHSGVHGYAEEGSKFRTLP